MKGGEDDILATLADGFHYTRFHFARGFVGEGEAQNVFAEKGRVGLEQMADTLNDDVRFSGACAGNDQERTFPMGYGALLRFVQLRGCSFGFTQVEKSLLHRQRFH
jgi:hypothetical protein